MHRASTAYMLQQCHHAPLSYQLDCAIRFNCTLQLYEDMMICPICITFLVVSQAFLLQACPQKIGESVHGLNEREHRKGLALVAVGAWCVQALKTWGQASPRAGSSLNYSAEYPNTSVPMMLTHPCCNAAEYQMASNDPSHCH
jgi:hypothetical protein